MTKLTLAVIILAISNILAWFQLNTQFMTNSKFWNNPYWMGVVGIPIGTLFFIASKLSYEHFGFTWNIRMIGFGVGTIMFGIMSYIFLNEVPTIKTIICILLAIAIILIQVTNVVKI